METMNDDRKNSMNDSQYDFGTDAEVVPPSDPRFDAWLAKVAPSLNVPNAAPRQEMWDAIQAAQQTSRDAQARRLPGVTPQRRNLRLMSAIAAAVLLGVAIDRLALQTRDDQSASTTRAASPPSAPADPDDPSRLYRVAAAQTLTQAEALLTAFRASAAPQQSPVELRQLGSWGRQVLGTTRLLIDSPAGDDPQLRTLLNDLELVLVQIIQLSGAELDPAERGLIEDALEQSDLLPRIRIAVPAGPSDAASGV
jgi:hypothetical protein